MALPSIATIFDWDIATSNMVISEEENHASCAFVVFEKTIPKTLDVHDFIQFFLTDPLKRKFPLSKDNIQLKPYQFIFSPPPEA